jgi:copper chaperone CopZ
METMLMNIAGMANKANKTEIKNALKKIEGVDEVGVNLATGTIKVDYNDPATEMKIKNCVENSGFEIVYE